MKKQVLFLAMFTLALIFASNTITYGQCNPDPLHPAAGVAYNYSTTILGPGYDGNGGTYEWFVTTNPNIFLKASAAANIFTINSGQNTNTVSVTWTAEGVALAKTTPVYLALWYTEPNATDPTCLSENVRAIQIAPVNTFLLAIQAVDATGAADLSVCAAPIVSALVNDPANIAGGEDNTDAAMKITYGANTLYYKITASGVNSNWTPQVRIPALVNSQTYTSADWYDGTAWNPIAGVTAAGGDFTLGNYAATVAGSTYSVRLVINNNDHESVADQALIVAIDGSLFPGNSVKDIVGGGDCTDEVDFGKTATQTILARPTVTPGVPAFMAKTPAN